MPEYEINWNAFGILTVEADDEEDAAEQLREELFGIDWDGLDWEIEEV